MTRLRTLTLLGLGAILSTQASLRSQDRSVAVPDMAILLQNERVRVQFHDVAPGETTPLHSHPSYVAYVFNEYTARNILPDGTETPLSRKPGDVFYSGPVTHRIRNTGKTPIHNLIVELKDEKK